MEAVAHGVCGCYQRSLPGPEHGFAFATLGGTVHTHLILHTFRCTVRGYRLMIRFSPLLPSFGEV